jgi:thiamine-monophosphate kinase
MPSSIAGVPVTRIGALTKRRTGQPLMTLVAPDGGRETLEPGGWEHFATAKKTPKKKLR